MKKIAFICIGNSIRSQMAEGFAKVLGKGIVEVYSAGSRPRGFVDPMAVQVMKEKGIDISSHSSKSVNDLPQAEYAYIIGMGCGDECPLLPAKNKIDWSIDDPVAGGVEKFKKIRDEIEGKVKELINKIKSSQ
ncbi:arsenate reductase ArsC [Candidatus Margulisiibacteriota bacterium]